MASLRSVAIAGGTGNLGAKITSVFLRPEFRAKFKDVIVLSRSAKQQIPGATIREYGKDEKSLAESLYDVDVVINAVGPSGHAFKEQLLRTLPHTKVQVYFPSEFGVNHYIHDFDHEEWDAKKHHYKLATELIPGITICRVYAGLFLEDSIGPWFGFFTKQGKYEAIGYPNQPTSYTSIYDVGKALAVLASKSRGNLPGEVQLNGTSNSVVQIAKIMEQHGAGAIDVSSLSLDEYKQSVIVKPSPTPERYLRFLMGEGKIDHSAEGLRNHNDLVEKDAAFGRWMSMDDLARETGGLPWVDIDWNPAA